MKKYIAIGTVFFILLSHTIVSAESLDFGKEGKSAILLERDTGKVLYSHNVNEQLPPASMTKIMTMLLIMEAINKGELSLKEKIRVSERASSMGGSQVFLETGEEMTVKDLLKGVAIASGNDASVALAERIAGSEEAFVEMMNKKAKQLNLKNTHFVNSSGLPADDHYSTAYDTAIISKELLKYEAITEYTSIYEDYLRKGEENEFWLVNTNKLVRFYPGVDGLKTGYTNEAKYCLTATAKKDNMRVIAVVMGAETSKERNAIISNMLDYAFNHYEVENLYEKGETVTHLNHLQAQEIKNDVVTSESISTIRKKGEEKKEVSTQVHLNEEVTLPLKKGDQIGVLTIKENEDLVSETPLIIEQDVNIASFYILFKRSVQNIVNFATISQK